MKMKKERDFWEKDQDVRLRWGSCPQVRPGHGCPLI